MYEFQFLYPDFVVSIAGRSGALPRKLAELIRVSPPLRAPDTCQNGRLGNPHL